MLDIDKSTKIKLMNSLWRIERLFVSRWDIPLLAESGLNFPDLIVQHLSISRGGGDNWINALIALTHNQTW